MWKKQITRFKFWIMRHWPLNKLFMEFIKVELKERNLFNKEQMARVLYLFITKKEDTKQLGEHEEICNQIAYRMACGLDLLDELHNAMKKDKEK